MNDLLMLHHKLLSQQQIGLPRGYVECDYIENTSTAYIDTGWKPNQNTKVKAKIDALKFEAWKGFFGCRGKDALPAYALYFSGKDVFYGHFGSELGNSFVSTYKATGIHDIEFDKGVIKIDTNTHNIGNYTYQLPVNMYLFSTNENNRAKPYSNIRIYNFKIWDNDVLKRDYIPCLEISSGLYGLYDKVEKKFYTSPNGIEFVGGNFKIDSSTQSFITAAKITDNNQVNAVNGLVVGLKKSKIWDKINALYPFVGANAESHSYNLIDNTKNKITWASGVTHDKKGVCGHNTTGGNLNFNTSVIKDKFNVSTYVQNGISTMESLIINSTKGINRINVHTKWTDDNTYFDYGDRQKGRMQGIIPTGAYRFMSFNVTSQKRIIYQDKVERFTTNEQLVNVPSLNLDFAYNTWGGNNTRIYSFLSIGSGLSDHELLVYNNLVNEFQTRLGRNV